MHLARPVDLKTRLKPRCSRPRASAIVLGLTAVLATTGGTCNHSVRAPAAAPTRNPFPAQDATITVPFTADLETVARPMLSELGSPLDQGTQRLPVKANILELNVAYSTTKVLVKAAETVCDKMGQQKVWKKAAGCLLNPSLCFIFIEVCVASHVVGPVYEDVTNKVESLLPTWKVVEAEVRHKVDLRETRFTSSNDTISVQAIVAVQVEGRVESRLAEGKVASCGINEEEPRIQLDLDIRFEVGPDGQLMLTKQGWKRKWLRNCTLTAFDISVDDILNIVGKQDLIDGKIDAALSRLTAARSLRPQLEAVWSELGKPRKGPEGFWLDTRPISVSLGEIQGDGGKIRGVFEVVGRPHLMDRAPKPGPSIPLPPIGRTTRGTGFQIQVSGAVSYARAASELTKLLTEEPISVAGQKIRINAARLYGSDDRAVVGLQLSKPIAVEIFLWGIPRIDAEQSIMSFDAFDFTVETEEFLLKEAEWILHSPLRDFVRSKARLNFDRKLKDVLKTLKGMKIPLKGAEVEVTVDKVVPIGTYYTEGEVVAVVEASGTAAVALQFLDP